MTSNFQLVRVDHDIVDKINLQIGNNIIGRTKIITECNDVEIIKHAVTITLSSNNEMTITPYQLAPCYIKSVGPTSWRIVKLGTSVPIKPGDVCSLFPKCWFKIISESEIMEKNNQTLKRKADEDLNNEADKKPCPSFDMENVVPSNEVSDNLNDKDSSAEHKNSPINGNIEYNDANTLILQDTCSASALEGNDILSNSDTLPDSLEVNATPLSKNKVKTERLKKKKINLTSDTVISTETGKKIKWDCGAHFSDETNVASSTKNNLQSSIDTHLDQTTVSNPGNSRKGIPKREKCVYGARCYRKNPNHRNNNSHPGDPDCDEVDDREECPYGVKCYRKNPQHKVQFKHTTVRRYRKATPARSVAIDTETDASSAEESVDESDYEPSVYTESSDTRSEWDDSQNEWEDDTTG